MTTDRYDQMTDAPPEDPGGSRPAGAQWDLMRAATARGGKVDSCSTRYDHDRGGRVVVLTAFYPGETGYP